MDDYSISNKQPDNNLKYYSKRDPWPKSQHSYGTVPSPRDLRQAPQTQQCPRVTWALQRALCHQQPYRGPVTVCVMKQRSKSKTQPEVQQCTTASSLRRSETSGRCSRAASDDSQITRFKSAGLKTLIILFNGLYSCFADSRLIY